VDLSLFAGMFLSLNTLLQLLALCLQESRLGRLIRNSVSGVRERVSHILRRTLARDYLSHCSDRFILFWLLVTQGSHLEEVLRRRERSAEHWRRTFVLRHLHGRCQTDGNLI